MLDKLSVIVAVSPSDAEQIKKHPVICAHMAYRIGDGLILLRAGIRTSTRGGLMTLSDRGLSDTRGDSSLLCQEILGECLRRGYDGVVADFGNAGRPALHELARLLSGQLEKNHMRLYAGDAFAQDAPECMLLLPCQVTGGRLREYLDTLMQKYDPARVCLDMSRLCHDFSLFDPRSGYVPVRREKLQEYAKQCHPIRFFSPELFANYFTCRDDSGGVHFILYDDGYSLSKKIALARTLGFSSVLLLYTEISDIADDFFKRIAAPD